eukprot:scaffold64415_cov27-Tisochrysis_lutea.AAC.3
MALAGRPQSKSHLYSASVVVGDACRTRAAWPSSAQSKARRRIVVVTTAGVLEHRLKDVEWQPDVAKVGRQRLPSQPMLRESLESDVDSGQLRHLEPVERTVPVGA